MGANHSGHSRSVNMENQNASGVVELSEDVVKRLKIGLTKEAKKKQLEQQSPEVPKAKSEASGFETPTLTPSSTIMYIDKSTSLNEVRRREQELQQMDIYWRNRLTQLEQNLNKTNKVMEDEYSAAVEDVKKRFATSEIYPNHNKLVSLQSFKSQLIACFHANKGEPLNCSEEVAAFTNFVSKCRIQKLDENNNDTGSVINKNKTAPIINPVKAA